MKTLAELKQTYGNNEFFIAFYDLNTSIQPKKVRINDDLTVWHDGGCIINGMKDKLFDHALDQKSLMINLKQRLADEYQYNGKDVDVIFQKKQAKKL